MSEDPPIPRYQIKRKSKEAYSLSTSVFSEWVGTIIDAEIVKILVRGITEHFNLGDCNFKVYAALVDTLSAYIKNEMDTFLAQKICLQVVWNLDYIKKGDSIPEMASVTEPTWIPFQITEFNLVPNNDSLIRISLLAFAGRQAGCMFSRVVPFRYLRYFAYQIGFSSKNQYDDNPAELIGLRFIGLVVPDRSSFDVVKFSLNQAMSRRNRKIIKNLIYERDGSV